MKNRTPRLLAVLLAGTLVLGACGDDDAEDAADPDEATTSTTAPEDGEDDAATDDDATDDGSDGADDEGSGDFDASILAGIDDFCDLDDVDDEAIDQLFESEDPAERREGYDVFRAFFVRALQIAPSELKGDLQSMADGMEPFLDLLEEHDYDFMAMYAASESDPELAARLEALEDPELQAASDRVDVWIEANCD
jgi:hypothetical protein